MPVVAKSPYAAAKLAGELYMQAFAHTYGLETVRLRFFNIFGPRQRADSPYSGVIALFTAAMAQGRVPAIHGDGLQSRDFTFVANAVQANILASVATDPDARNQVYNVAVGDRTTLNQLYGLLRDGLAVEGVSSDAQPTYRDFRAGDVRHSQADVSKARQADRMDAALFAARNRRGGHSAGRGARIDVADVQRSRDRLFRRLERERRLVRIGYKNTIQMRPELARRAKV